jgi:GNAT superfamily N-acetyltransferase
VITYQVERWAEFVEDLSTLWDAHWEEVALDKDKIKLDPHVAEYERLDETGQLHIVSMRDDGWLVGYSMFIVRPHLHYVQSLSAFNDVYYVKPEYRGKLATFRFFQYQEATLKERGVERMFTGTKMHLDNGRFFERLGWTETERLYTKYIGDD